MSTDNPVVLLPCPFCGGKAEWGHDDCSMGGNVTCTTCGARVYEGKRLNEYGRWNRRASGAAVVVPALPADERAAFEAATTKDADGYRRLDVADHERLAAWLGFEAGWQAARAGQPADPLEETRRVTGWPNGQGSLTGQGGLKESGVSTQCPTKVAEPVCAHCRHPLQKDSDGPTRFCPNPDCGAWLIAQRPAPQRYDTKD